LTQAHLVEKEGKPVAARDILVVARRLVRVLEGHGLQIEGCAGERTAFDPNRHQFLAAAAATATPDQPVVVRFPAALFQGKVLLKAGVEPLEE
jgi:molecular chaperone GrpE (heat shock protein)